ncbi:MAG: PHP domain-containing protein [Clostridiales bacterium]|jgi:predicted metal-dependent phosphoesterase TrpH|nr:PHP domain-containing protein [Clostridiales bacterium]
MKISIHIHSEYSSDSRQTVSSIIEESRRLGYDTIAITDHNTVAGSLAALEMKPDDMSVIIGAEFSTEKGHILALFIDDTVEKSCPVKNSRFGAVYDFDALTEKVRAQGGLLFLAHPLHSEAPRDHSFVARLDGYELINGRVNSSHNDKKARQLGKTLEAAYPDKALIGGSDAHIRPEIKSVFMISEAGRTDLVGLKQALLNAESICFTKTSMAEIRFHNMRNHRTKHLKYHVRQFAAMLYGLLYDLSNKVMGASNEVIRIRKETE